MSVPDHEGRDGHVGRAVRTRLPRPRRRPRRAELRAPRPVPGGAGRAVGLLRRRPGQRMGRRGVRRLRARAEHRRRGARARRSATSATPSAGSTAASTPGCPRWWWPRSSHIYPDLDRVIQEHATDEGKAMLLRLEKMTTVARRAADGRQGHGRAASTSRSSRSCTTPEVQHVFDEHQAGHRGADAAGADRAGGARPDRLGRRHRRAGRHVLSRRRRRDLPPRHVQRAHAAAPDVGADGAALAHRPVRRPAADEHLVRTKWPTLLNPMTYVGMARLAKIAAKVVTGRTVERRPL